MHFVPKRQSTDEGLEVDGVVLWLEGDQKDL
jgi:hypothetical protein